MKIINAGYNLMTADTLTKKVEKIARICYKSEDLIKEGSDEKMINALMSRQHYAMLEHGDIALIVDEYAFQLFAEYIPAFIEVHYKNNTSDKKNEYFMRKTMFCNEQNEQETRYVVSGNLRAWINALEVLTKYMSTSIPHKVFVALCSMAEPVFKRFEQYADEEYEGDYCKVVLDFNELSPEERMIHETFSILFTVDRGVTHELVRHRPASFAQESTRYCNYSKGKFGNEITVIYPCFFKQWENENTQTQEYFLWERGCKDAEKNYFALLNTGATPQQARSVLPTSVKADIVMTANLQEWKHVFDLRACDSTGPAHPQMHEIMVPLFKEMRTVYPFAFGDMLAYDEVK